MSRIQNFNCREDYRKFLKTRKLSLIPLGMGSEGSCHKSQVDQLAYKVLWSSIEEDDPMEDVGFGMTNLSSILTTEDILLPHFLFPIQLHVCKEELLGYTSFCAPSKNLFHSKFLTSKQAIRRIPFDALKKAYDAMQVEMDALNQEKIEIFDLAFNLIFDGESLYAIDTTWYKRRDKDVHKANEESLKYAIRSVFSLWIREDFSRSGKTIEDAEEYLSFLEGFEIENYLKQIENDYCKRKMICSK